MGRGKEPQLQGGLYQYYTEGQLAGLVGAADGDEQD